MYRIIARVGNFSLELVGTLYFGVIFARLRQAGAPTARNKPKKFLISFTIRKTFFCVLRKAWQGTFKLLIFQSISQKHSRIANLWTTDPIHQKCWALPTFPNLLIIQLLFHLSIYGPKRDEVTGNGENYIIRSFMICTHPVLFR